MVLRLLKVNNFQRKTTALNKYSAKEILYIQALFLNFQYWHHWLVYVCGLRLIFREAFRASHCLITWRSPYPGEFFKLLFNFLIITALEFLMGCGRMIFNISQSVHYALSNRVYLLHISRQAFFTKKLCTYSHFRAYLLLKISINFYSVQVRYFFFTYFVCTTFKPVILFIYHKNVAELLWIEIIQY